MGAQRVPSSLLVCEVTVGRQLPMSPEAGPHQTMGRPVPLF